MNWKINYWTFFFVLMIVAWLISCNSSPKPTPAEWAKLQQRAIPPDAARARIDSFQEYANVFAYFSQSPEVGPPVIPPATVVTNAIAQHKIINPDIRFFKIPKDDILALAKYVTADTIYGVLSLRDTTIGKESKSEIDLLFYVQPGGMSQSQGDGGTFYDFTEPCPNSCPNPPPPPFN